MHLHCLATRRMLVRALALMLAAPGAAYVHAQPADDFVPVTDAMLESPAPADWLMTKNPARHSSGPIIAGGKAVSGRSCWPWAGPEACVIIAHDATTGAELWRRRLVPAPGEPGDETWGAPCPTKIGCMSAPGWCPASTPP